MMMQQLTEVIRSTLQTDERRGESGQRVTTTAVETKILKLSDVDNIEAYLMIFEHLMT